MRMTRGSASRSDTTPSGRGRRYRRRSPATWSRNDGWDPMSEYLTVRRAGVPGLRASTIRTAFIAIALLVAACGAGYEPWPKNAGNTTCAEWLDQMSTEQRVGLANAILAGLWSRAGAVSTPSPEVQTKFANAIGGTCASYRTESVSSVASGLYTLSDDVKP